MPTTPHNAGISYEHRRENLYQLGFHTYRQYLRSKLYARVRRRAFAAHGPNCRICLRRATEIHHERYRTGDLNGKYVAALHPICRACHEWIQLDADGHVVSVSEANAAFERLRLAHLNQRELRRATRHGNQPHPAPSPKNPSEVTGKPAANPKTPSLFT
jgi:hypothetical protein